MHTVGTTGITRFWGSGFNEKKVIFEIIIASMVGKGPLFQDLKPCTGFTIHFLTIVKQNRCSFLLQQLIITRMIDQSEIRVLRSIIQRIDPSEVTSELRAALGTLAEKISK